MIEACEFELAAENDYYCTTHKVYFKNDSDCPYKHIAELRDAVSAYYAAVITRNSTPYPDPDERMFMARLIDETQAAMFALLQENSDE